MNNKILTIFVFLIILSLIPSAYAIGNETDSQDYVSIDNSQVSVNYSLGSVDNAVGSDDIVNSPEDNVVYVDASGSDSGSGASDSPFQTIKKGLTTVGSNGTLYLNGEFKGDSNTNLEIKNANLVITSEKGATIDGGNNARIFSITNSTLVLNNVNFVNAFSSTNGGAIYVSDVDSSLTISNSLFENNSATASSTSYGYGGAIYSKGFITFKDNVTFKNNSASYRGGAIYADAGFNITGNNFYAIGNCLPKGVLGGFIYSKGDAYISGKNMLFAKNYATGSSAYGGAIYVNNFLSIVGENITFNNNSVGLGGGAIRANQITLAVNDLIFTNNSAKTGGAIMSSASKVLNITGNNILFDNNTAIKWGGAISSYNVCYIKGENITFVNNLVSGEDSYNPGYGGAISSNNPTGTSNTHKIILDGVTFTNNTAAHGGAVAAYTTDIKNSVFIGNSATIDSGALYTSNGRFGAENTISNSVFVDNKAESYNDMYFKTSGYTTINNNWWGDNNPNFTDRINNAVPTSYAVLNLTADPSTVGVNEASSIIANFYANNTTTTLNIPTRDIKLSATGGSIVATGNIANGKFTTDFTADTKGTYTITAIVDGVSQSVDVVVSESSPNTKIYVNASGFDDNNGKSWSSAVSTLAKALSLVDDNGVIYIADGNYLSSTVNNLNKNVTIVGQNQNKTILDANKNVLFNITSGYTVCLSNLTMVNAYSNDFGGVIVNNGKLTVNYCSFENNTAYGAAAIDNSGVLTVIGSYFYNNKATDRDAGAISNMGTATIINSTFDSNKASRNGGAIKNDGSQSLTITGCNFINNVASGSYKGSYGGAIYNWNAGLTVSDSTFVSNSATDKGGAIYESYGNTGNTPSFIGSNLIFISNLASLGDAVYTEASNVNISNSAFVNHTHAVYRATSPDRGTIDLDNNWWDSNSPVWSDVLVNIDAPKTYAVLDVATNKVSDKSYDVIANMYWNGTTTNAIIPTRDISFTLGSKIINKTISNAPILVNYQFDESGKYVVAVKVDDVSVETEIGIYGHSDIIYVNATGGDDSNNGSTWSSAVSSLTKALELVNSNGIIYVANGDYLSTSTITFDKNVSIVGEDSQKTIFDANKNVLFNIASGYTIFLSNLTMVNAYSNDFGGAIVNNGKLTVYNSILANNSGNGAGAIDNSGVLSIIGSYFYNNQATGHDAGAISNMGNATIINSTFDSNKASRNGGAIKNSESQGLTITGCVFINNIASGGSKGNYGGAIYNWIANSKISSSIFINNSATDRGGAIYASAGNKGDERTLNATDCVFINNSANEGSAIFNEKSLSDVENSVFVNNSKGAIRSDIAMNINGNWWGNSTPNWDDLLVVPDRQAGPGIPTSYAVLDLSYVKNGNSYYVIANLYLNGTTTKADVPLRDIELVCGSDVIEGQLINSTFKADYKFSEPGTYTVSAIVDNDVQSVDIIIKEIVSLDDVYVNYTGGNDNNNGSSWANAVKTLENAFTIVKNNGIIHIADGVLYNTGVINVNKDVTFIGQSQDNTVINGNGTQLFTIAENKQVSITNLTITNCVAPEDVFGGAISNSGSLSLTNTSFIGNSANGAGAIDNSGKLTVISSYFANNKATGHDAGAISNFGSLEVINSVFVNNSAFRNAGAIKNQNSNDFKVTGSTFIGNTASGSAKGSYAGAIYSWMGNVVVSDCEFINNSASDKAGAIYVSGGNKGQLLSCEVTGSTFINNTAKLGGAIYTEACNSKIEYNAFINNSIYNSTGFYGNVSVNNNWWGNNTPDWTTLLFNVNTPNKFAVLNINVDDSYKLTANMYWNGTTNKANVPARNIDLSVVGANLNPASGVFDNGTFTSIFSANKTGNYTVTAVVDNEVQNMNISVIAKSYNLIVDDVEKYFKGDEKLSAKVVDENNNPIANATVVFNINGINYTRTTDVNGSASMAVNLAPGLYNITTTYNNFTVKSSVVVKSTIEGSDIVKMYQNETQFYATFLDSNGKALANTTVKFNINGVFYNRTTDSNGTVKLNINLNPGNYTLTAYNPVNGEEKGFNVLVKSLIETNDLTKYYQNASKFEAKIYNKDGSLAINKTVEFNINGVFYKRATDENGTVKLAINLRPGNYSITTMYDGLAVGNNVNVLPTLETKDLSMKFQDGSKFSAITLDGQGKPLANQNVTFNVNGVFYYKTTDENGTANLNINLNKGQYIITSMWDNYQVGNTIKID